MSLAYIAIAVSDVIAAVIAFYVFYRLLVLYARTRLEWSLILGIAFITLFTAFLSSFAFFITSAYMTSPIGPVGGMHGMHHGMGGYGMPAPWGCIMNVPGVSAFPWLLTRLMFLTAYALVLVSMFLLREREHGEHREEAVAKGGYLMQIPLLPLVLSVNLTSAAILLVIIILVVVVFRSGSPLTVSGYAFLLASHILEAIAASTISIELLLEAEVLRPFAMFLLALGVKR